jgi:UDPglucose 6-dehydrogenase
VLGHTFKPETDDMRDSASLPIIARLMGDGASVRAFDPQGMEQARPLLPDGIVYCRDAMDAAQGADALVVVTEWNQFRALSPAGVRAAMRGKVLVDLRNMYDPVAMTQAGFAYHSIGRGNGSR